MPDTTTAQSQQISQSAWLQINAILDDKANRTPAQRKIDSGLLLALKRRRGDALFQTAPQLRSSVEIKRDGSVLVDISADVTSALLNKIRSLGGTVVSSFPQYDAIRARLPLNRIEALAEAEEIRFIRPADKAMHNKVNTSEGDVAHITNSARTSFGLDGSGVNVGVLSDGVDSLAALQASGDLPAVVTVLSGQAGSGSEGTAMLEIVFDLAPGAGLNFATAFSGQAQFAQNINDLAAAGADVIVDDVYYFAEPVFQDGIISLAVNAFTDNGGLYFSSAGNAGNFNDGTSGVFEGDFVPVAAPPAVGVLTAHDFGSGTNFNTITADPPALITLQWADPQGGSGNDYDLILMDSTRTTVIAVGANTQDGDDDPFEAIGSGPPFDDTGNTLVIIQSSGENRFLHMNTQRGQLAIATDGQTSGHGAATHAFGVAAVNVATAGGSAFTGGANNPVETFSSDGPRRVFFDESGTPFTPGNFSSTGGIVLQKPDIAAADGVMTATPGFNPFFGTSAAAPHAAAMAALLEENGNLTPDGLRQVFAHTALDIEAPGFDRDSGVGVLDGFDAVSATSISLGPSGFASVPELHLNGIPNNGSQTFRAADLITAGDGTFNNVTLIAFDDLGAGSGTPGSIRLNPGFSTDGPFEARTTAP